ncbi:MAG: hypothetical protein Q9186_002850 [Xanthomendoza sp. 1 TL-2023]
MDRLFEVMSRTTSPFYVDSLLSATYLKDARRLLASSVHRRLGHSDGYVVGHLLLVLGIPIRHLNATTSIVVKDWRYPEHRGRAWESNQAFIKGRDDAYSLPSQDFQGIREDTPGTGLTALFDRRRQSVVSTHNDDSDTHATPPQSSSGGTDFAAFLEELKTAAFDIISTEANDEDNLGLVLKHHEYDCTVQNSADFCKGLEGFV